MEASFSLDIFQIIKIALVVVALYFGLRLLTMKWSYNISKPHKWEDAVKNELISKDLKKIERTYRDKVRFYSFWLQIERLKENEIEGAFAELGVYQGETARFIHLMDPTRSFLLFDTFDGFNKDDLELEKNDDEKYDTSNFSDTSLETVKEFVNGNSNVQYFPGYFPESTTGIQNQKFAFVHLDADLYKPTLAALNYFYPKLNPGGVIIIHDYNHTWDGLRKSIEEFSKTIPESIIEIADWQGSAMIIKNRG